ncbi:hypothetical protein Tco_0487219 [Tanacetum coccineum]
MGGRINRICDSLVTDNVLLQAEIDEEERQRIAKGKKDVLEVKKQDLLADSKRDVEEELVQESSKRLKTGESSVPAEELKDKEEEELVDLVKLWSLLKEKFTSTKPTEDKERELSVELKKLFEPDTDDELWKLQKHIHDVTWRLYDTCGVDHVSTKDGVDIYMLVEKEYPLSRGVLRQMLVVKLLVEQDSKMSRELLRKIFMQLQLLSDYYCWKEYADRDEIKD